MVAGDMTATVERRTEVDGAAGLAGQALQFLNSLCFYFSDLL
jgi:hypothetical protein